jgi:Zn-finger nucleic acid-binding protein
MSNREGIEIDYCPVCRGVWLDRGELDKIIERSAADQQPQAAAGRSAESYRERGDRDHDDRYRDDDYYKKRKRRSMLGDLFDFD